MTRPLTLDLYAGPGGWAEGLRMLGQAEIGIELDPAACATRAAAGHRTIRADATHYPPQRFTDRVDGLIASPPCQEFSTAGPGRARNDLALTADVLRNGDPWWGPDTPQSDGARHILNVGQWIELTHPRWVCLEQVPPVLPLWEAMADWLHDEGWSTWAGILNAADYGVAQTRRRAILIASRLGPVQPPTATHAEHPQPDLWGQAPEPWVSMADALGWPDTWEAHRLRGAGMTDRHGTRPGRPATEPAPTVCANGGSNASPGWVVSTGTNSMKHSRDAGDMVPYERPVTEPAPTLDAKVGGAWMVGPPGHRQPPMAWKLQPGDQSHRQRPTKPRGLDQPAPTLAFGHDSATWAWQRPATTVAGDPRLSGPGRNAPDIPGSQYGENTVRINIAEALTLQSFPSGYPVAGTKTQQFQQVGNAVPPLLAAHILAAVTGHTLEATA